MRFKLGVLLLASAAMVTPAVVYNCCCASLRRHSTVVQSGCLRFQHFVFWRGIPSGEVITPLQIGLKGMK